MAVTVVEDLVSRKWLAHIVSAEETSTQIEVVFTDALAAEGTAHMGLYTRFVQHPETQEIGCTPTQRTFHANYRQG